MTPDVDTHSRSRHFEHVHRVDACDRAEPPPERVEQRRFSRI
jgi:hypothetical protein